MDSTTTLVNTFYQDLKSAVSSIADALGVAAEHVYGVLIMQQVVNSITYLTVLLLGIIFIITAITLASKIKFDRDGDPDEVKDGVFMVISIVIGVIGIITLLVGLMHIPDIVTGFVNPEYGAIREIKSFIK